jgi:hypothetical protein
VKTRARLPGAGEEGSWEALDAFVDAVESDVRALGASVAGEEDGASVFLSVEAASVADAKRVAEAVVADAVVELRLEPGSTALLVYDEEGNVAS